ncbi:hypothetical protein LX64_01993 [Chitinophaga skermanii]|uniref:Uncharacterized protein n=1 Tax=Chitinophaga skermanii TaxID=331697 RepID=A0A327QSJ0_9BACT|nr:hypothetical protein [Chitinophaga skermanii]RAJ06865.1 hypothetical protein LX64_01993 [Chitinophaga skermanii]
MGRVIPLYQKNLPRVSFHHTQNGFLAIEGRKKTNWQDERYEKIRSHRKEFGRAAQMAADTRLAFSGMLEMFPDKTYYRRLSSSLLSILKSDVTHLRGERTVEAGDVTALTGFDFNQQAQFNRTCRAPYTIAIDRKNGVAKVTFPAFKPSHKLRAPKQATHFQLIATVHAINFDTNRNDSAVASTVNLPLDGKLTAGISLDIPFEKNELRHLFVSIGVVFVETLNNRPYNILGGRYNAMCIAAVSAKVGEEEITVEEPNALPVSKQLYNHANKTGILHASKPYKKPVITGRKRPRLAKLNR